MDTITAEPCNVCGNTEVNLVDGFYYCVECGTQDANVRETLIENKALADGTFMIRQKRKLARVLEEKTLMSPEWYKWHAYNFILAGLGDEMIACGAKPSFKKKLLWLWSMYMNKFQNKEDFGLSKDQESLDQDNFEEVKENRRKKFGQRSLVDISVITKGLLMSFVYIALNLDQSEIQLSDLSRFAKEGQLHIRDCTRFVPKDIEVDLIPGWINFKCTSTSSKIIRLSALPLLVKLQISPVVPDLRKIVDKFIIELCLPEDFKQLVLSLMHLIPCDHLNINRVSILTMLRTPHYEMTVMSYIMLAFKMCFGLDDYYEMKLSDAVDKINDDNCHLKSHKLGSFSEPSDRLFSFREWCNFIEFRKIILSKYYLYMAEHYEVDFDDLLFIKQYHKIGQHSRKPQLSDEITMNMLDKIPFISEDEVIPRGEFKCTTIPLYTYTELILKYFKDPELSLLLSEDFSQYSLKYACETLHLGDPESNIIIGVDETKKVQNSEIYGLLNMRNIDKKMVFVRNCKNKNWYKTKRPTKDHIKNINDIDKDSDHGYNSNSESASNEIETRKDSVEAIKENEKFDVKLDEEDGDKNIFDDNFFGIKTEIKTEFEDFYIEEPDMTETWDPPHEHMDNFEDNIQVLDNNTDLFFNPNTFNRNKTIRDLVLATCAKYKINIPNEFKDGTEKAPRKRKPKLCDDGASESSVKRRKVDTNTRTKPTIFQKDVKKLLFDYYNMLKTDPLYNVIREVKKTVNNMTRENLNTTEDQQNSFLADDNHMDNEDIVMESYDNIEVSENFDQTSVECLGSQIEDNREGDPKFDPEIYDVNQLYVAMEDEVDFDGLIDIEDDPETAKILDKKIEEFDKNDKLLTLPGPPKEKKVIEDLDDDLPLSVLKEGWLNEVDKEDYMVERPLVKDAKKVKDFGYWTRFYASEKLTKNVDLRRPFNHELIVNFPKSFGFVLKECSSIADCSPSQLYKDMIYLERVIMTRYGA